MKRRIVTTLIPVILGIALLGCESDTIYFDSDSQPPATPRGVYSVTGDEAVKIVWLGSDEQDLAGYRVWRSNSIDGAYDVKADIEVADLPLSLEWTDRSVTNGATYFYAVTSYDYAGNESDLSYEDVYDTPRPAGFNVRLYAVESDPGRSGFDFSRYTVTSVSDDRADIIITRDGGVFFAEAVNLTGEPATDIQDFGYTENLDALDWAPPDGWSTVGWSEIIYGHTYAVWTRDNHYAKFRVTQIGGSSITIDWAYQIDLGNPELKPVANWANTEGSR
jgi:hypothetical protein